MHGKLVPTLAFALSQVRTTAQRASDANGMELAEPGSEWAKTNTKAVLKRFVRARTGQPRLRVFRLHVVPMARYAVLLNLPPAAAESSPCPGTSAGRS